MKQRLQQLEKTLSEIPEDKRAVLKKEYVDLADELIMFYKEYYNKLLEDKKFMLKLKLNMFFNLLLRKQIAETIESISIDENKTIHYVKQLSEFREMALAIK
jgi:hypothetical protein